MERRSWPFVTGVKKWCVGRFEIQEVVLMTVFFKVVV